MMKSFFCITLFLLLNGNIFAQQQTRKDYIKKYKNWAIAEMRRTGIPASITLAQGVLESNSGNSTLARKANNHFGIKCNGWQGKTIRRDDDKRNECFRKYNSAFESYKDHSNFLSTRNRYAFLFEYDVTNYKSWARGLKKAGYATAPDYAQRLIKIIEEEKLFLYDSEQLVIINRKEKPGVKGKKEELVDKSVSLLSRVSYKNGVKYLQLVQGDTYYSIEKYLGVKQRKIRKYNDFVNAHILKTGEIIFLNPKKGKAEKGKKIHKASGKETLHDISQLYAVKFRKLKKFNPQLSKQSKLQKGKRVKLRRKK